MSKEPMHKKKRSYSFHDSINDSRRPKPWQVEKSRNKAFQKNLIISKASKKCNFNKNKREDWIHRKLKKEIHKDRQPPTPHNTTQFIVDAVYYPTDPYIYEYDSNKLEYNFQHHAMAGSMMELMQQRFNNKMEEELNSTATEERDSNTNQENSFYIPKLRTVKSADDRFNETTYDSDTSENKSYNHFLNEAKNGKNLEDIIKQLVCEIRKKDDQINTLLADTNKQVVTQEN